MNDFSNKVINYAFRVNDYDSDKLGQYIRENYTEENRAALIEDAKRRKVLPVVGKLMVLQNVDVDYWTHQYEYYRKRNQEVTELMDQIFSVFLAEGIYEICVYENYGALLASGTDIALYSSGDVDLFANIAQKDKIEQVLAVFEYYPTNDFNNKQGICTEYLKNQGIIRINIAWKPLIRYSLPIKSGFEKYFFWDKMHYYKNTTIRLPTAETLLYLCFLRIAVHGYSRSPDIRLYIDTFNASCTNPDWNCVIEWAKSDGVYTKFATVAAIAHDLIGLEIPEPVLLFAQTDKFAQRILMQTYNFNEHLLKYDLSGIHLLKVEAASDNRSVIGEILNMLFPPKEWIKEYYQNENENMMDAYKRYYKRLL